MKYGRLRLLIIAALLAGAGSSTAAGNRSSGSSPNHAAHVSQNALEKRDTQPPVTGSHQDRQRSPASEPTHVAAGTLPDGDQNRLRDLEEELAREQLPRQKQGRE